MEPFTERRFQAPRTLGEAEAHRVHAALREGLERCPEVVFAYLHGSFARGEPFRDADVAVYCARPLRLEDQLDLGHALSQAAGLDVDLQLLDRAPVDFQMAVLRDGKLLLSRDDELRADFIDRVSRLFPEHAHFRNVYLGIDGLRRE
ncbi:MAG: nucleotidyltransferase domain-containing protein [Planctomycetes bacterium]|nr:nucleotidyltransferase domain-containing protein [Planctomycetota bacterium]